MQDVMNNDYKKSLKDTISGYLASAFYGTIEKTPFYRLMLGSKRLPHFHPLSQTPWPGSGLSGRSILRGHFLFQGISLAQEDVWDLSEPSSQEQQVFYNFFHSFEWLEDLRAISDNTSRRYARALISAWITKNRKWTCPSWSIDVMGRRLSNWLGVFDFFATSAPEGFRIKLFKSMMSQYRHLRRHVLLETDPYKQIQGLKGILFVLLALPNYSKKELIKWLNHLSTILKKQVLEDGGHQSFSPLKLFYFLKDLIDIRSLLCSHDMEPYPVIQEIINQCAPVVRLFRHGDGRFAFFEQAYNVAPNLIDMVLSMSDVKGRPALRAVAMGFERCHSGRQLILFRSLNPSAPFKIVKGPEQGANELFELQGLDFDWSIGKDRLILKGNMLCLGEAFQPHTLSQWKGEASIQRAYQKEAMFLDAHVTLNNEDASCSLSRQLYMVEGQDDFRACDVIQSSQSMTVGLRFVFPEGTQIQLKPHGKGAFVRIQGETLMWNILTRGVDEMTVDHIPFPGAFVQKTQTLPVLFLLKAIEANQEETIQWAFHRC